VVQDTAIFTINVKKLPYKFNIYVRVETTYKMAKVYFIKA